MKKIFVLIAILSVSTSLFFFSNTNAADANSFKIESFSAEYRLSKNDEGRAEMNVREKMVAIFPNIDQNRGIERAIPKTNDGHNIFNGELKVWRNGEIEEIGETDSENGMKVFRFGDADKYVHGRQEYLIEYKLTDVITNFDEHQELYWNVNGTQWAQDFGDVRAKVIIDNDLKDDFTGEITCFSGGDGSTNPCQNKEFSRNEISFSSGALKGGETLTFAMKFKLETFTMYQVSDFDNIMVIASMVIVALTVLLGAYCLYSLIKKGQASKTNRAIIPQYLPPKDINIANSAALYAKNSSNIITPIILDLAVNGKISIKETLEKGAFGRESKKYSLNLVSREVNDPLQKSLLKIFFPASVTSYKLENSDTETGAKIHAALEASRAKFNKSDYFRQEKSLNKLGIFTAIISAIIFMGIFCIAVSENGLIDFTGREILLIVSAFALICVFLIGVISSIISPKSAKGSEMSDYLKGLEMYMNLAEADRLKYLQSVETAERITTENSEQIVKLYEKLLPYASIFNIEKSWAKVLEVKYQNGANPDWYHGNGAFNAMIFASAMNNFSSSMNSYNSNSGSGGNSGFSGGSAGGGGGGGGGGGW